MEFGGYRVDTVHRTVTRPGGAVVRLEPKAFDLLIYFAAHPEETLSRERLIADVWGGKFVTDDAVMVGGVVMITAEAAKKFLRYMIELLETAGVN